MKQFNIVIRCIETLDTNELWPDGDAPENPTEKDVYDLIEKHGGPKEVLSDWNLDKDLDCEVIDLGD